MDSTRRRRRIFLYAPLLFLLASDAVIYFGVEHIRGRNARFDEEVKKRDGLVSRQPQVPEWMDSKYLKPAARWLEPLLPARVSVLEKHADLERVRSLCRVQGLDTLDLDRSKITDSDLAIFSAFGGLRELAVSGSHLTDACFDFLPRLRNLKILRLDGSQLTNQSLARIKEYADGVDEEGLYVDLQHTKVCPARDVHVTFPGRVETSRPFEVALKFNMDEELAATWSGFTMIETRILSRKSGTYVITNQWLGPIKRGADGGYSHMEKFRTSPPGEHEWSVWLMSVPVGRAMVAFTLAEGRVQVDPAPPAAPAPGK